MLFTPHVLNFVCNELEKFEGNYLEIGVYYGESIKVLSNKFPNKKILAIDPFIEDGWTSMHSSIERGGKLVSQRQVTLEKISSISNIILFEETSLSFFENLSDEKALEYNVNIIFIDGDHHYENVRNDCILAMKLLGNKRGIVIFDDNQIDDVRKAKREFEEMNSNRISKISEIAFGAFAYFINES